MHTLTELPSLMPRPALISVHGLGRGGGERVADKLRSVFALYGGNLALVNAGAGERERLRALAGTGHGDVVLLTAGPRDLLLLLACAWHRRFSVVYLQVPYLRSITWRDPGHALAVLGFLLAVTLLGSRIFANSRASAAAVPCRRVQVVWPVTRQELAGAIAPFFISAQATNTVPASAPSGKGAAGRLVIDIVCRLAVERGRGSRDLAAMLRLLGECRRRLGGDGPPVFVRHFGEVAPCLRIQLQDAGGPALALQGHREDWLQAGNGPVLLLSRYEGFGLAAFEAASVGRPVYVNEAFPEELLQARPSIRRVRTAAGEDLLPQLEAVA